MSLASRPYVHNVADQLTCDFYGEVRDQRNPYLQAMYLVLSEVASVTSEMRQEDGSIFAQMTCDATFDLASDEALDISERIKSNLSTIVD